MEAIYRISTNLMAFTVLILFFVFAQRRLDRRDALSRMFFRLSIIVAPLLLVEALTVLINRQPFAWLVPVSIVLHVLLFAMGPILTYLWYRFILTMLVSEQFKDVPRSYIPEGLLILGVLLALLTPIFGWVFTVGNDNVYTRGPLFLFTIVIVYIFLLLTLAMLIKHRKKVSPHERLPFIVFCLLPIFGGVLQTVFYGVLTMWSSAGFTFMFVYVFLQQRLVHTDYLTGAWTRETFMKHIEYQIEHAAFDVLGMVYIDIDNLKTINDAYGHAAGDVAIIQIAKTIRDQCGPYDIFARLGGDEFILVIDTNQLSTLKDRMVAIETALADKYQDITLKNQASFSWGAGLFVRTKHKFESFLHDIDLKMYATKRAKTDLETPEGEGFDE